MLIALACIPIADKIAVYVKFIELDSFPDVALLHFHPVQVILKILLSEHAVGDQGAHFSSKIWDCSKAMFEDTPQINNSVKGWHRTFGWSDNVGEIKGE